MRVAAITIALIWLLPLNAYADCYAIKNQDNKNYCLAKSKAQSSYCYMIKGSDSKNNCLAETMNKRSYCYNIKDSDLKSQCLALIK
jgi:hypothetical protein